MRFYFRGVFLFFEDRDWPLKLLVGSIALASSGVVPMVGTILLMGWGALIARRAARDEASLPRLDFDVDYLFTLLLPGLKTGLAWLVWTIPAMLIGLALMGCVYFTFALGIAQTVFSQLEPGMDPWSLAPTLFLWALAIWAVVPVFVLTVTFSALPAYMAAVRVELSDDLEECTQFGEVLQMTQLVLRELLIATVLYTLAGWVLMTISLPLGGLPLIPVGVLSIVARAWLGGALYRRYLERGGDAIVVAADAPAA